MEGERRPALRTHAEHAHREATHGTGDPIAVEVERRQIGGANISAGIHLHPVDDRKEVVALQVEGTNRLDQRPDTAWRLPCVQCVDIRAPPGELRQARAPVALAIGDIIDRTAEAVDLEHGAALR